MRSRTVLAVVLSVLLFAACGSTSSPGPGSSGTPPAAAVPGPTAVGGPTEPPPQGLDGRTFVSTAIDGRGLVAGSRVRLSFGNGTVGASAGCNQMGGSYVVADGILRAPQLAMTEMACEPALMAQDEWLAAMLNGATIALEGDTLTLARDGVTLTLVDREVADPDRPLEGTTWIVEGLITNAAVSSVPAGAQATLTFSGDQVQIDTGCNTGTGTATVADGVIAFSAISLTRLACAGPARELEGAVLAALGPRVGYTTEADSLTLDAGGVGLVLRAAP